MINFDKLIPNVKTYLITTNYRSTNKIVDLANKSIRNNTYRVLDKIMRPCEIMNLTD